MSPAKANPSPTAGPRNPLLRRLLTRGFEFDFFQAVWLLERYGERGESVGGRGPVARERFRFRPDLSMAFPSTDVRRLEPHVDSVGDFSHYLTEVSFMGLYGVSTPLPLHYAVDVLRASEQSAAPPSDSSALAEAQAPAVTGGSHSTALRDFLDVFHHRLISLFYRSWVKYRYDRSFGLFGRDKITDYLLWLIGCEPTTDPAAVGVWPIHLLRYAGVLTQRPRSASMLEGVLLDYWDGLPVSVEACVGRWVAVPSKDRNSIGMTGATLGDDLTVGAQVYDLSGAFNVTLGPMDWSTYLTFLPGEARHGQTCALVERVCADPLAFTIELKLEADQIPELQLTSLGEGSRLGLTSWVRTDEIAETSVTFSASSSGPRTASSGATIAANGAASTS